MFRVVLLNERMRRVFRAKWTRSESKKEYVLASLGQYWTEGERPITEITESTSLDVLGDLLGETVLMGTARPAS